MSPEKTQKVDPPASVQYNLDLARWLLDQRPALLWARNSNAATPLHTAAHYAAGDNPQMFQMLLGRKEVTLSVLTLQSRSGKAVALYCCHCCFWFRCRTD